jgi:hypothetical protein
MSKYSPEELELMKQTDPAVYQKMMAEMGMEMPTEEAPLEPTAPPPAAPQEQLPEEVTSALGLLGKVRKPTSMPMSLPQSGKVQQGMNKAFGGFKK